MSSTEPSKEPDVHLDPFGMNLDADEAKRVFERFKQPYKGRKLPFTREEYIKKQNAIFQELSGFSSWSEFSLNEGKDRFATPDSEATAKMLQLYLAQMDDTMFTDVESHLTLIMNFEHEGTILEDKLRNLPSDADRLSAIQAGLRSMNNRFRWLSMRYTKLEEQRRQADILNADMKTKYALELSKRVRLQHMVKLLTGRLRVTAAESRVQTALSVGRDKAAQQKILSIETQLEQLKLASTALEKSNGKSTAREEKDSKGTKESKESKESKEHLNDMAGLDRRLKDIYAEVMELKEVDVPENEKIPEQPAKLLARILQLIDGVRAQRSQKAQQLLRSYIEVEQSGSDRIMAALELALTERQIMLARCDRLEKQLAKNNTEIEVLTTRCESLVFKEKVLMSYLKNVDHPYMRKKPVPDLPEGFELPSESDLAASGNKEEENEISEAIEMLKRRTHS